jgi:CP family cyanate transporter-like MFS transporter
VAAVAPSHAGIYPDEDRRKGRGVAGHGISDAAEAPAGPPSPYRWVVLFGVWLIYASFGMTTVSLAPLVLAITRDLEISHGSMGFVFGAWQLIFIVTAVPAGGLLDRIGVGRALFLAALIIAASGFLRSVAPGYASLWLAVAVLGLGGPLISTGAPKMVQRWFHGEQRGLAMGIYITGPACGGIAALSLTNSVLMPWLGDDWQTVLRIWAAFALGAGLIWIWIASRPQMHAVEGKQSGKRQPQREVVGQLIRLPAVQTLLLMSVGIFLFNHGLNNWLPEVLRDKGMSPAAAGYWATLPTIVGVLGSLTIPRLATPRRRHLMLAGLCASALVASLLLRIDDGPLLFLGLAMQGVARSSMMTVAMLTLVETPGIGERHAATASGMFFSAAEIGGASGPVVMGLIHDASGGFGAPLGFLTAIAAVLVLASLRLRSMAKVEQSRLALGGER